MTNRANRRGATIPIIATVVIIAIAGVAAIMMRGGGDAGASARTPDRFAVERGSFAIAIPATGELEALEQVEVINELEIPATITELIPEGEYAERGVQLVKLADDELRDKLKDAEDAVNDAQNDLTAAESNVSIRRSAHRSEHDQATLALDLAELALEAWEKGEVVSRRKALSLAKETAEKNYARLAERFEDSKELLDQEFISNDEYKRDEIAMIEAKATLEQAELDIEVYEKYTYKKEFEQKRSDVEQARAELERVEQRHTAEMKTVEADLESKRRRLQNRVERRDKLQRQLDQCVITAPQEGLVVYATSLEQHSWRRSDPLRIGTKLSPKQAIMVLPDTSRMVARVKVAEALSGLIEPGQRATVVMDAADDAVLQGEVLSVGVLAETGNWRDPNRRDYTVRILIDDGEGEALGLKPSMRCKTEIVVGEVEDSLYVPIQAVFYDGPTSYVYVPDASGYAQRRVRVGRASELYIEVLDGLSEDQLVLLREPDAADVTDRLERDAPAEAPSEAIAGGAADGAERRTG